MEEQAKVGEKQARMISNADLEDTVFTVMTYVEDNDEHIRYAGAKLLELIAVDHTFDVISPYLKLIVEVAARRLDDSSPRVRMSAMASIASLAHASSPQDFEEFRVAVDALWARITNCRYILGGGEEEEEEARKAFLRVMNLCSSDVGEEYPGIIVQVPEFLRHFWAKTALVSRSSSDYQLLANLTVGIAKAVGVDAVTGMIEEQLHGSEGDGHAGAVTLVLRKAVNVGIQEAVQDMIRLFSVSD